jgi:hypothetical protein
VKTDIQPKTADIPPFSERPSSAEEKTRVVRFEVSPATTIHLVLVAGGMWLLLRLWPVLLVLAVALLIVGTMSPAVSWMEARGVKRNLGIAIVFTLLFVVAALAVNARERPPLLRVPPAGSSGSKGNLCGVWRAVVTTSPASMPVCLACAAQIPCAWQDGPSCRSRSDIAAFPSTRVPCSP